MGLALFVGHSKLSLPFRYWLGGSVADNKPPKFGKLGTWLTDLLECPMCLGFWTGLTWGLLMGEGWRALLRGGACMVSNALLARALNIS